MRVGNLDLGRVKFPGRAGEYQRARATAALVRELGDNYAQYHEFLAEQLAAFDGPPQPDDYGTFEAYAAEWSMIQNVVAAEAVLRNCRAFRRDGRRLDAPLPASGRLIDENHRLVRDD